MAKADASSVAADPKAAESATPNVPKRKIPGNLPYLTSSGTIKSVLEKIVDAQQPARFNADFLENVLNLKGGAARATVPIMKKMGFITSDGVPTELYAKFRTNSGRGAAALQGLQSAFGEIFRRSTYAHNVPDSKLRDLIVEVTGLAPTDPVATAIRGTFNSIKHFVPADIGLESSRSDAVKPDDIEGSERVRLANNGGDHGAETAVSGIRLSYNINIVLPETSDLNVLNAIFRSIKDNLMK